MKKTTLIVGGILVVLLLAGAAFVGARLLNGQGLPGFGGPGFSLGRSEVRITGISADDILPAKELPQPPADVGGIFDHRQDKSIFIGTGLVMISVQKNDQTGEVETSSKHDGPTVEVVVTSQTKIYKDVTMKQFNDPPPEGEKIQQALEEGSLDEVGQNSTITVWGGRTGDRIIANVFVYQSPDFIKK